MKRHVTDFLHDVDQRTEGEVRTDQSSRLLYSTDASLYQVMPYGVLIPKSAADVHAAVETAAKYRVPILPRTAGSSLAGQAVNEALIIDFTKHLNQLVELNEEEQWVRVQPGMVLDALNQQLRPHNLQFGPDPASSNRAGMGGIVGNNSTGSHSIVYGMAVDHILGATGFLSNGRSAEFGSLSPAQLAQRQQSTDLEGEIYRRLNALLWDPHNQAIIARGTPQHWRRCGGYNLDRLRPSGANGVVNYHPLWPRDEAFNVAKLLCGSEGTLAVLTELKLNLVPRPQQTAVAILHFDELRAALEAVPAILEVNPSAVELFDNLGISMCREVREYAALLDYFLIGDPNCILITEFYGKNEVELRHKVQQLEDHLQKHVRGVSAVKPLYGEVEKASAWTVRKVGLGLLMSVRSDYKPIPFIEDSAVPVEHLPAYVARLEEFCHDLGTKIAYYAHVSAGCLHIRPLINTKLASEVEKLPQIAAFAASLLGEYGGALSSEHGDGRSRSWLNERFFGKDLYRLYQEVKQIFDPENILNPGNIVNGPSMTENLRFGAEYQTISLDTILDFSADQGFASAVEMCNGAGVCRKVTTGVMCPSFMATREELDSTRGRANLLRSALSGRLDPTGPDMAAAMDLCLSCKACKSECPSSVDMAKIKSEWLYHYRKANGTPLRAKLFANIERISHFASSPIAPLLNFGARMGLTRKFMSSAVGIGGQRPLPNFARTSFAKWYKKRTQKSGPNGRVALFCDTYNCYNTPEVAVAAAEVLEAAGYEVLLAPVHDSGRPAFSKGLLDLAKKIARKVLTELEPLARQKIPIIFLEPSELSAVVDDYRALLPEDGRVGLVANSCLSFEQFVAREAQVGSLELEFRDAPHAVLLHGHCHQKALFGTAATHAALRLVPQTAVAEVDSTCCGMAGSFGYESEHYDISMRIGEERLLPAVRASDPQTILVAPGVSCRQQIKHATQREALHPAQFLRSMLTKG